MQSNSDASPPHGFRFDDRLQRVFHAAERRLNAVNTRLGRLRPALALRLSKTRMQAIRLAEMVDNAVRRVLRFVASLPARTRRRIELAAAWLLHMVIVVFVVCPHWLITVLSGRCLAALLAIVRVPVRFFRAEVIPTSAFFVEVPWNLGRATARDLFIRLPYWGITRGPRAFTDATRWTVMQLIVIVAAMFDRAEGLMEKLIDRAFFVYEMMYGGVRALVVTLVFHFAPQLLAVALHLLREAGLAAHQLGLVILTSCLSLRHGIIRIPKQVQQAIRDLITLIPRVLAALMEAISTFFVALPLVAIMVLRTTVAGVRLLAFDVPMYVVRWLWRTAVAVLRVVVVEIPAFLGRTFVRMVLALVHAALLMIRWLWRTSVSILRWLFSELPVLVFKLAATAVLGIVAMGRRLRRNAVSALHFVFLDTPVLVTRAVILLAGWYMTALLVSGRRLSRTTVAVLRLLFVETPSLVFQTIVQLAMAISSVVLAVARWLVRDLPALLGSALMYCFVTAPRRIARGALMAVKALGQRLRSLLQPLAEPVANVLTWTLALAVAPFYLLWQLTRRKRRSPPSPPTGGEKQ